MKKLLSRTAATAICVAFAGEAMATSGTFPYGASVAPLPST